MPNQHRPGYHREYYASHKEEHKQYQAKCPPRIHVPDSLRESRLRYLYKMTVEDYESLLSSQEGHCALCEKTQDSQQRRMAVDHDHACCSGQRSCGKCLRGILCADCNRRIGFLEQVLCEGTFVPQPGTWAERALQYLKQYKEKLNWTFSDCLPSKAPTLVERPMQTVM